MPTWPSASEPGPCTLSAPSVHGMAVVQWASPYRPEVIVALGKFAAQTLLRTKTPITQMRGRWFDYHGIQVMPTFHPAYLIRSPGEKKKVWEDIKMVMRRLGIAVPAKESEARSQESGEKR
jgi:hypothetical protein